MANVYFLGGAAKTPYVNSSLVTGTPTVGGSAVATVNSKTVTYTIVTGDTRQMIVDKLITLLGASSVPGEHKQFTYDSPVADTIRATGPSDGAPVTIAFTVTGATVAATTVTQSSPHDLTNVINWSTGALPSGSDTAIFDRDVAVKYNLTGLSAIACAIKRTSNHRSDIGLPDVNPLGFVEYRTTKLTCLGTVYNIYDSGAGTVRIAGQGTLSATVNVSGPDASQSGRTPTVELYGSAVTWTLTNSGGSLKVAQAVAITEWTTVRASVATDFLLSAVDVKFNSTYGRVTLTVTNSCIVNGPSDVSFGDGSSFGAGDDFTVTGATVRWLGTGTIDSVNLGPDGYFDASGAPDNFTITDGFSITKGATINDPYGRINLPLAVSLDEALFEDVTLNFGTDYAFELA